MTTILNIYLISLTCGKSIAARQKVHFWGNQCSAGKLYGFTGLLDILTPLEASSLWLSLCPNILQEVTIFTIHMSTIIIVVIPERTVWRITPRVGAGMILTIDVTPKLAYRSGFVDRIRRVCETADRCHYLRNSMEDRWLKKIGTAVTR